MTEVHTDGNGVAGLLGEVLAVEVTQVLRRCHSCGAESPLGAHRAYEGAGTVLRCPACDDVALLVGVRDAILEAFGDHYSPSVQFTLRRMGRAVLKAVDAIERVHLSLPNRHHLLYDLSRFGLENPNEIFHATTEPYGLIEGTVEREQ